MAKYVKRKKRNWIDSFMRGAAYLFDSSGELFRLEVQELLGRDVTKPDPDGIARDQEMIAKDWQAVGDALRDAMNQMDKEIENEKKLR